jgi:agmatine/peptidylarginine deiminase
MGFLRSSSKTIKNVSMEGGSKTMKKGVMRAAIVFGIGMLFVGASITSIIGATNQKINDLKIVDTTVVPPLPRWREGGTPYNPEQSRSPYGIRPRDAPTSGLIESHPEYSSIRGVLFCYKPSQWTEVVVDLVVALTADDAHDEIAYVVVENQAVMNAAISDFTAGGANMEKVEFIMEPTNALWIRDYGPHFIFQDGALGIVDSHYYPQRPLDNFIPTLIGDDHFLMPTYDMGLYYSGGNFLPSKNRTAFMSSLVTADNPPAQGFDEAFIAELFHTYQGIDEMHIMPQLPATVDVTGHIDMWMYIMDEDTVIISEFKPGSNSTAIEITNNAVPYMESLGYTVYRTPAWNAPHPDNGYNTHWTYTNCYRVNNRIFIPTYGSTYPDYADEDAQALAVFQAAAPDLEIIQINCFPIIWAAGAMHCIVMQVPRCTNPKPAVHVISPDGGELLVSGTVQPIEWAATDTNNIDIPQIDLYYSVDGGSTYEFIASTTDTGLYNWTVPAVKTTQAVVKVIAKSSDADEGVGVSAGAFNISSASQSVYDFVTGAGTNKYCYGNKTGSWSAIDGVRDPVTTQISPADYPKIAYSDATGGDSDPNRYISPIPYGGSESTHVYVFTIKEAAASIADIGIVWEGYSDYCTQTELYVWDYITGQWGDGSGHLNQNRYMDNWAGNRDGYLDAHLRSDYDRYISPTGQMTFLVYTERTQSRSFHDYISLVVSRVGLPPSVSFSITGGLGVHLKFTNNGTSDVPDVPWQIHIAGGILGKINKTVNGTVDIPAGKSVTVKTGMLLGFGAISITAKVADEEQTATGIQIIIFSMVK